jgi:ABC-type lipoprotein release transport system permease subunit
MRQLALLGPIAWRNLWRSPRRTGITLAVVAIGMWSILGFQVLLSAWAESTRQEALRLLTGDGQIHAQGYLGDPGVAYRMATPTGPLLAVLQGPQLAAWAPRIRVSAVIQSEYRTRAVTLVGVTPAHERQVSDLPGQMLAGRYLASDGDPGIVIGQDLARRMKTRLGKRVIVMLQAADGHLAQAGLTIIGLFGNTAPAQDEYVFVSLGQAQSLLGVGTDLSEIAFEAAPGARLEAVVGALRQAAPALDVQSWITLEPLAYTMQSFSQSYIGVWLMVMFVLMAIGIVNTQLAAVLERTRELGLLAALGMAPSMILAMVLLESALLTGAGVLAGLALMHLTLIPWRHGLDLGPLASSVEKYGVAGVLHPHLAAADAVRFTLLVWALGVAATLWPARRAARASPLAAMSTP